MTQTASTPTALHLIMSEEETETVLNHAQECLDAECPIDEVDDLVNVLKTTESELQGRLEQVMNMISTLQHLNEKEERKTDEVRAFVSDMLRVFNTDVSLYICSLEVCSVVVWVRDCVQDGKEKFSLLDAMFQFFFFSVSSCTETNGLPHRICW